MLGLGGVPPPHYRSRNVVDYVGGGPPLFYRSRLRGGGGPPPHRLRSLWTVPYKKLKIFCCFQLFWLLAVFKVLLLLSVVDTDFINELELLICNVRVGNRIVSNM